LHPGKIPIRGEINCEHRFFSTLLGLDAAYRIKRLSGSAARLAATELLARAESLDLELLKQIQALDPVKKPTPLGR